MKRTTQNLSVGLALAATLVLGACSEPSSEQSDELPEVEVISSEEAEEMANEEITEENADEMLDALEAEIAEDESSDG